MESQLVLSGGNGNDTEIQILQQILVISVIISDILISDLFRSFNIKLPSSEYETELTQTKFPGTNSTARYLVYSRFLSPFEKIAVY